MKRIFFLVLGLILLLPLSVEAQFGPIVPEVCRTCACGFGGVLAIVQNVVNFMIGIAIIFATIIMVWAGGLYILSAANPESRSTANKMLLNAVIGLLVVLAAWLIVDFVMKTLYNNGSEFGPWNSILLGGTGDSCVVAKPTTPLFSGNILAVPGMGTGSESTGVSGTVQVAGGCTGTGTNSTCSRLPSNVVCEARGCYADAGLAAALGNIRSSVGWAVTEGYPKSRSHRAACHSNGTCVDVGLRPRNYTIENIIAFDTAAKAAGLRPVYEEKEDRDFVEQLKRRGVNAIFLGDHISADHFSVYAN